ncbi:MAG: DsrE family protein [Gemmatimonadales bacterium]
MSSLRQIAVLVACVGAFAAGTLASQPAASGQDASGEPSRLAVLWTSGERDVALKMVFMYTLNAKRRAWFEEVQLIVWGPSSKLLSVDEELQAAVAEMEEAEVELVACKACADSYGVSGKLEELGVEVRYMGEPLTEMLKGDWVVVTF